LSDWLLLCDDWLIVCPRCIRANLLSGASPYERATWRWASRSFCPRHQIPLVQVKHLPDNITECDRLVARLNDTENLVARDLIAFERDIARAHRGIAPPSLQQSLTAPEFLQVLKDLTMFAVKRWNVGRHPRASCVEQHARMLTRNAPSLFDLHLHKRSWQRGRDQHVSLTHIPDPAIRRAAIWLAMEVIRLPPTPRPKHDLRLGFTAQDDFFGYVEHEGWEWLAHQAQAWPILYRSHYWEGFTHAEDVINLPILLPNDTVKGTDDIVKGSE
jgi:hypothetical protein